jgi:hypothetical protein
MTGVVHVDALDVFKICLRRWYIALSVLLLAIGAALGLASRQPPTYHAFATYALVYQDSGRSDQGRDPLANPLGAQGGALLGEALAADFMSGASQAALGRRGNWGFAPDEPKDSTYYSVSLPRDSQSYLVQTWGQDPVASKGIVDAVLAAAPSRAEQIQDRAGAPRRSQFTTFTTSTTEVVELPQTSRTKLIGAIVAVGMLAGSALSIVADRLSERRRRRPALEQTPSSSEATSTARASESLSASTSSRLSATVSPMDFWLSDIPDITAQEAQEPASGVERTWTIEGAPATERAKQSVPAVHRMDLDQMPAASNNGRLKDNERHPSR